MPSKPDTFAEVVRRLTREAEMAGSGSHRHEMLLKAARLLAAAGEYAKANIKYADMTDYDPATSDRLYRDVTSARAALNALAPELKENDHAE